MKTWISRLATYLFLLILFPLNSYTAVVYVDVNGLNPTPPYTDWSTAATNIQNAIDASSDGDLVLVTNGVYQTGGEVVYGILTNRVVINKAITVQSVNGPAFTAIEGYQIPGTINGDTAVRCVYMTNNAVLAGFTLTNGATRNNSAGVGNTNENSGGGVLCASSSDIISNCVVVGNSCYLYAAGIYSGTVNDCQILNNTNRNGSDGGGGLAYSTVFNSTISSNYLQYPGAGAFSCNLSNCIIDGNSVCGAFSCTLDYCTIENNTNFYEGGGALQCTLSHCLIFNNRAESGGGTYNCALDNCTLSNNAASSWGGGAYVIYTNAPGQNNTFIGNNSGTQGGGCYLRIETSGTNSILNNWNFTSNSAASSGGGLYLATPAIVNSCNFYANSANGNGGGYCGVGLGLNTVSNCNFYGNIASGGGGGAYYGFLYNCVIIGNCATNGGGVWGSINDCIVNDNIATNSGGGLYFVNPASPQAYGSNCYFTNNTAGNGGAVWGGNFSNCVFFANSALTNGGAISGNTLVSTIAIIQNSLVTRNQAANGGGGYDARFVSSSIISNSAANGGGLYLGSSGFNLVATNSSFSGNNAIVNGGGIYGGQILGGCVISGNSAGANGGGTYDTSGLYECILSNNFAGANGGGASGGSLIKCAVYYNQALTNGGGAFDSTLSYCTVIGNSAQNGGGVYAAYNSQLDNCLVADNSAAVGGGTYGCFVDWSTIAHNTATNSGGGIFASGIVNSSIVYDNSAPSGPNYGGSIEEFTYSCTTPLPTTGNNNISSDPAFINPAAGNFRLQTNSPCINAGNGSPGLTDLDGRPRVVGSAIDMGAYEFQGPGIGEFTTWLQQYGLSTSGSADYIDSDGDGMNNWQEWIADTIPTNALSVLKMLAPPPTNNSSGLLVSWESVNTRTYYLQSSTNLAIQPAFSIIQSNLVGQVGTTSYLDTNAVGAGPFFYRVGIQ